MQDQYKNAKEFIYIQATHLQQNFTGQKFMSWKIKSCLSIYQTTASIKKIRIKKNFTKIDPKNH